jgi:hypothetical protein
MRDAAFDGSGAEGVPILVGAGSLGEMAKTGPQMDKDIRESRTGEVSVFIGVYPWLIYGLFRIPRVQCVRDCGAVGDAALR